MMPTDRRLDDAIDGWLATEAPQRAPERLLRATFERTRATRQDRGFTTRLRGVRTGRAGLGLGAAATIVVLALAAAGLGPAPGPAGGPSPVPSASAIGTGRPSDPPSCGGGTPSSDVILGCSKNGKVLLIQKEEGNLWVRYADGSEAQVTQQLTGAREMNGSLTNAGAAISPDGSRIVFAGLTKPYDPARNCHDGALFAVGAGGGPATLLWVSHAKKNGIIRDPTFSPDGTRIAFVDDYCDQDHHVWVMNADGSDAHLVFSPPTAGHVSGLAWSPAGDRLALAFEGGEDYFRSHLYTFAPDGSDVIEVPSVFATGDFLGTDVANTGFCWRGLRC